MFINFSPTNKTVHNYLSRSTLWTKKYSRYKKQRIALIKLWELCIFPVELFHISVIFYCRGIFRRPNLISNNDIRIIILMRSQLILFCKSLTAWNPIHSAEHSSWECPHSIESLKRDQIPMWFTKDNHLRSCIRYANVLPAVIIFIRI